MAELSLFFRVLPEPLSRKAVLAYRKDAGWDATATTNASQDPRGQVQWVAVEFGNRQVGVARLELAPPQFCYVADLVIVRNFRGRGVGRWFVRHIEQYCRLFGIRRLLLEGAAGTADFYAALGFGADPALPSLLKKEIPVLQAKAMLPER